MKKFLAIGDITNDAFISLSQGEVRMEDGVEKICMRWGDKIPFDDVVVVNAVGNSPNAAVSSARIGLDTSILTYIGDDKFGDECIQSLENENVKTDFVFREENKKTNYHYVLSYKAERTILVKHEDYSYQFPELPTDIDCIYFSSTGEKGITLNEKIVEYVKNNPKTKLVFQPGTFQMSIPYEKLKDLYSNTYLFICNLQEAQKIQNTDEGNIKNLLNTFFNYGIKNIVITDGINGAYSFDGNNYFFVPTYPDIAKPKERTGAGDAFSSTLAIFLTKGFEMKDALLRAPINSMSVVQKIGAQEGLLTVAEIEKYLSTAPNDYKVSTF